MDKAWAEVELFRAQYGELPKSDDTRKIDYGIAFKKASENCRDGKLDPHNAASLLWLASEMSKDMGVELSYDKSIDEKQCFLCHKEPAEYKGTMGDRGERFDVFYCYSCLDNVFKTHRPKGKHHSYRATS